MKTTTVLLLASAIGANAIPQGVPELPKLPTQQGPGCAPLPAGFKIPGAGVEMRPQDIPTGCSAFEVLIGKIAHSKTYHQTENLTAHSPRNQRAQFQGRKR